MSIVIQNALKEIYISEGGILRPETVVRYASNPDSSLHSCFTWDDTAAAHQWRLNQARQLIKVNVEMLPGANKAYSVFVSLSRDRTQAGGGYRLAVDVLSSTELRDEMVEQALSEFKAVRAKYERLRELIPIFAGMDVVERRKAKREARKMLAAPVEG